jgi:hypothetical protein
VSRSQKCYTRNPRDSILLKSDNRFFRQVLQKGRQRSRDISRSFVPIWELESGIGPVMPCALPAGVTDDQAHGRARVKTVNVADGSLADMAA